ncbi:uncharacterized protein BXZ73DRAFT_99940 [Epithele typhae]|uniref:uncharacterized protein n=1 Tax=Epithele typhae TaxID=378194 RepID=UPI0020080F61|nr:uncharacterized protein BXZ73DRAFT_99940 [Epithele typhae]KAH9938879.1 hypothetical protein BXZ73DRAFT_99940 [Epithele typhae]
MPFPDIPSPQYPASASFPCAQPPAGSPSLASNTEYNPTSQRPFVDSDTNNFGVFRRYYGRSTLPLETPEDHQILEDLCDGPGLRPARAGNPLQEPTLQWIGKPQQEWYAPFANPTQANVTHWRQSLTGSGTISHPSFDKLLDIMHDSVVHGWDPLEDGFSSRKSEKLLDEPLTSANVFSEGDWLKDPFPLSLPKTGCKKAEEEKIRNLPRNPADKADMEYGIIPMILWSDATHLANFSDAKMWPVYLYFAHLCKYTRGRPTEFTAHHIAYIPSLPDTIQEAYANIFGKPPTEEIMRFLKRDLFQQIWLRLMNTDFMEAYEKGVVYQCTDGVTQRMFPRLFAYAADYPEKILATALKPLSTHPCPTCLTTMDQCSEAGSHEDMKRRSELARTDGPELHDVITAARKLLFKGYSIVSDRVRDLLKQFSLNPIRSAFSTRLAPHGVNSYDLFAPDIMHEFELGVWKGTFHHVMRMLDCLGNPIVEEFNTRMPTFGNYRIRKVMGNIASRKGLAARDYEAFLIMMMPAMEGLLPLKHNEVVQDLLFELANFHALGKLQSIRRFDALAAASYQTVEQEHEAQTRVRRAQAKESTTTKRKAKSKLVEKIHRKAKKYTVMQTYKYHALGHWVPYIRLRGPMDVYSTQIGECEHKHVKLLFRRTNRRGHVYQIARLFRNGTRIRQINERNPANQLLPRQSSTQTPTQPPSTSNLDVPSPPQGPLCDPHERYDIAKSSSDAIKILPWIRSHFDDPAVKDFYVRLREYVLSQILGEREHCAHNPLWPWAFTLEEHEGLEITDQRMFSHKTARFNYTNYALRREQDHINIRTHADVIMLAPEDSSHPYLYARVIGVFHLHARYNGPGAMLQSSTLRRFDLLWHRLKFVDHEAHPDHAFGFQNLNDVVRAAYIVPAFDHGLCDDDLPPTSLARAGSKAPFYTYYYVMMFADRDMYMRHLGGGVGHQGEGIHVEDSQDNAARDPRIRPLQWEPTSGARLVGDDIEHPDTDVVYEVNFSSAATTSSPDSDSEHPPHAPPDNTQAQASQQENVPEAGDAAPLQAEVDDLEERENVHSGEVEVEDEDACWVNDGKDIDEVEILQDLDGCGDEEDHDAEPEDEYDITGHARW